MGRTRRVLIVRIRRVSGLVRLPGGRDSVVVRIGWVRGSGHSGRRGCRGPDALGGADLGHAGACGGSGRVHFRQHVARD